MNMERPGKSAALPGCLLSYTEERRPLRLKNKMQYDIKKESNGKGGGFMQIYDISQELFGCAVYPGDPAPARTVLMSTANGDLCNLTALSMCAHNGTHVDAPFHFYGDGKTIDQVSLEHFIGEAYVVSHTGDVTAGDAAAMLKAADMACRESVRRLLIRGSAVVTLEAAEVFAQRGLLLLGNESQTVGPEDAPMAVHLMLLAKEIVLLEGIRLQDVPDGAYLLQAAPLNLGGADGAPCRAVLLKTE